jgi:hypothetical protein
VVLCCLENRFNKNFFKTLKARKTTTRVDENPDAGLGQIRKCGGVKALNEITFYIWISDGNTDKNRQHNTT